MTPEEQNLILEYEQLWVCLYSPVKSDQGPTIQTKVEHQKMMAEEGLLTQYHCPQCDHRLFTDDMYVWCSRISSIFSGICLDSCGYGVKNLITLREYQIEAGNK